MTEETPTIKADDKPLSRGQKRRLKRKEARAEQARNNMPPKSGVAKDLKVDLAFPLLVSSIGTLLICARVVENQHAQIGIIDTALPQGHPAVAKYIANMSIAFGPTPEGVTIAEHQAKAIQTGALKLYEMFMAEVEKRVATPQKVLHGANGSVLKVVQ